MKRALGTLLLAALPAWLGAGAEQLIPGGSVMQCMVSQPHLSSKTEHVGDPVLCQVGHTEMYGRSVFPYGSYLVGRFEDYKDPGHFVGKGWMELKFDRMVVGNDTVIPISTRVVSTSAKYPVDRDGKIHGTGHPVRDTIEWMIPVLWPIDLINLPRRGPYPELKPETRLTVMVLDDFGIPTKSEVQHLPEMISKYNYADNQPAQQQPAPIERAYARADSTGVSSADSLGSGGAGPRTCSHGHPAAGSRSYGFATASDRGATPAGNLRLSPSSGGVSLSADCLSWILSGLLEGRKHNAPGDFPGHYVLRRKDDLNRLLAVVVEAQVGD